MRNSRYLVILGMAGSIGLSACGEGGGSSNTVSLSNSDLLYRADVVINGTFELFTTTLDGNEHRELTQASFGSGVSQQSQISPDGHFITFINQGNMLKFSELYVDDLDDTLPAVRVSGDLVAEGGVGAPSVT